MPYYALQLDQLPKISVEAVLTRYGIRVMEVENVHEASEDIQRVFLEIKQTSQLAGSKTLASYSDLRPSKRYPKTQVGVMCSVHACHNIETTSVSVHCHAFSEGRQIGGEIIFKGYADARNLALAFVDYACSWIDPDWFNNAPHTAELSFKAQAYLTSGSESSSPERQRTKDLLNRWSIQISEKLDRRLLEPNMRIYRSPNIDVSSQKNDASLIFPDINADNTDLVQNALIYASVDGRATSLSSMKTTSSPRVRLTKTETASIWKRLCGESRGLCRLRSKNYACSSSDSELILRRLDSLHELKIILHDEWILQYHGDVTEKLRIVKSAKGSICFEGTEKISSIPRLALKFIQDLAETKDPLEAGSIR